MLIKLRNAFHRLMVFLADLSADKTNHRVPVTSKQWQSIKVRVGFKIHPSLVHILNDRLIGGSQGDVLAMAIDDISPIAFSTTRFEMLPPRNGKTAIEFGVDLPADIKKKIDKLSAAHKMYRYNVIELALIDLSIRLNDK